MTIHSPDNPLDDSFKKRMDMAGGLAFLPPSEIPAAFVEWKELVANEQTAPFVKYIEDNYVLGPERGTGRGRINFPPSLWSVAERTGKHI